MVIENMTQPSDQAESCVLCKAQSQVSVYAHVRDRKYWHCKTCDLVFLSPEQRFNPESERARYLSHNNDPQDERYQRYLSKMMEPIWQEFPAVAAPMHGREAPAAVDALSVSDIHQVTSQGVIKAQKHRITLLDYGCGPTKGIETIWGGDQISVTSYDPFFFPAIPTQEGSFDAIVCCEAAEHFYNPEIEFERMSKLIAAAGVLVLRTGLRPPTPDDFERWGYHNDPTHVCFYSLETIRWIQNRWKLPLVVVRG